jgi:glycosyltransferase involved in cell wall biosynthesis
MKGKMMISICIIVKNDQENLKYCLERVKAFPYEIIVVDTGSTDQTIQIASEYTDQVYKFAWCNDFSAARNYAIGRANNRYVLMIDSDEFVMMLDQLLLEALIIEHPNQVGRIHRYNIFTRNQTEFTGHEYVNRLFDKELFEYTGKIHEQIVAKQELSYETYLLPIDVRHSGYDGTFEERKRKADRNINLLLNMLEENPQDTYILYQLGKSYYFQEEFQKAVDYFSKALEYDLDPRLEYVIDMIESYGYALVNAGYRTKALGLEVVYQEFEASADFVYMMGFVYMENAQFEEAIAQYLKATTYNECKVEGVNSYLAYYNVGVIYECLGNQAEALLCYEKCGEYLPAFEGRRRCQ